MTTATPDLERVIVTGLADAVERAYESLTRLDQHSGDGDFGDNLRGGVRIATERMTTASETPLTVLGCRRISWASLPAGNAGSRPIIRRASR